MYWLPTNLYFWCTRVECICTHVHPQNQEIVSGFRVLWNLFKLILVCVFEEYVHVFVHTYAHVDMCSALMNISFKTLSRNSLFIQILPFTHQKVSSSSGGLLIFNSRFFFLPIKSKNLLVERILIFLYKIVFRYWDVTCLYVLLDLTTILPGWAVQNRFCSTLTRYSPVQQLRTLTPWTLLAPLLIYQFHKQGGCGLTDFR